MAGQPAPELELAIDAKRLPPEPQLEAHALFTHPHAGLEAFRYQDFGQVRVAAVFGQPADIVVILFLGVGADIDIFQLVVADIGNEPREVVEAVIDDAPGAAGKGRIAAAPVLRRDLQHQHRGAVLPADSAVQVAALPAPMTITSCSGMSTPFLLPAQPTITPAHRKAGVRYIRACLRRFRLGPRAASSPFRG